MRRNLSVALAAAAVATAVLPGVSAAAPPSSLDWGPCPAGVAEPGLECSTLPVPLDHRNPGGQTIEVAISRLLSKNPAQRRGVLLVNPGGPGLAGLHFPVDLAPLLPQSVLDTYDVIGFDPRGTGHSAPVTCDLTAEQQVAGLTPPYAHDAADVREQAGAARAVARQCAAAPTAPLLPHITTANTARDMDRIRAALGEPKTSYYGGSYGSYLGAVYTTLFPERSDRVVLDSNVGPGGLDSTAVRRYGRGMQDRFPDFAAFAAARPQYGLGITPEQVTAKYFDLAARLDRTPEQGFDGSQFRKLTFGLLYLNSRLPALAEIWQAFDTSTPLTGPTRDTAARAAAQDDDNMFSSHFAVICGDSRWSRSVPAYQWDVALDRVRHPMLGAATANVRPCAFWPFDPVEPKVRIGDRGPSNVLMVQNLRDPGTPLVGARELRWAFGDRARMVTADQGGHGAYRTGGNTCADNAVTAFLTTGQRPAHDLACAAEPA
ncbi:alpha/beta hydrolase [Actinokineospora spheciospongiae]|uniref:alpha/beta hydrolase n=1 Tax=Actinokineospora spheciospongiae TaxID=909613 RepID=UPI000D70F6CA|nr:alpha/beta hydrolase [Actinokineospora spheciospongiae]PWW61910.1 TAP-like protein [Actinokineospora spheciospongiae]